MPLSWTVKTQNGNTIATDILNIDEYLKGQNNLLVLATLTAIKTIIVYE
jgi:hypothetical protein